MNDIVILGAGMAGYGAARKMKDEKVQAEIYEKNAYYGGHCASFVFDDQWIFDDGPHISFSKNEHVRNIFADNTNNDFCELEAKADNYWKGKWIKHPAQVNLNGLPPEFNTQILCEMIEAKTRENQTIRNYRDWLYAAYGKTFSENFPMKYTRKFHTTEAENMSIDWLGQRLYQPELSEVIFGMLSPATRDVHYVKGFRYPNKGGFVSFLKGIEKTVPIHFNHALTSIDIDNKIVRFANGRQADYNYLFSSLPLPELIECIEKKPEEIKKAAQRLAWTKCVMVNFGVNRPGISDAHWRYVYDEDFYSTRMSFPHMFGPNNAPSGCSSVQVEIYFSDKYRPLDRQPEEFIPIIKDELIKCGILRNTDRIHIENAWLSPFAQVIFDHDRKESVALLHDFLKSHDIYSGGRFADWSYAWSDESFMRGEEVAGEIIEKL